MLKPECLMMAPESTTSALYLSDGPSEEREVDDDGSPLFLLLL